MMSSANDLPKNDLPSPPGPDGNRGDGMEAPPTSNGEAPYFDSNGMSYRQYMNRPLTPELGPLGDNWEKAFTEKGEPYFIDKTTRTSSWLDPRLSQIQKQNLEDCADDELPFGWEKIDDPHYGSYYIDHVNRKTQYENPVLQAKRLKREREEAAATDRANMEYRSQPPAPAPYYCNTDPPKVNGDSQHQMIHQPESRMNSGRPFFTRDPNQLMGEIIHSSLLKGPRGLGFTIVGGDDHEEEFLQIKSVVPYGPAWEDGRLQTGDVLVYVNNICVLGFTHHDMVSMFQGISVGERVDLTVCRGYPLPFDPNDPNTEIVTTVAVSSNVDPQRNMPLSYDRRGDGPDGIESTAHSDDSLSRSAKSMPDLTNDAKDARSNDGRMRPGSADLLARNDPPSEVQVGPTPEHLIVPIVKGSQGFGFTIADAPYGQLKVKKIHDRMRCKNLMEGDILCEINNVDVRDTSRAEVVGLLSECPMEQEALILVFRSAYRFRKGDGDSGANSDSGIGRSSKPTNVFAMYRSKTPTADLYRTEPREIIPHRPKTPLLDTRQTRKNSDLNSPSKPYPGAFSYSSGFVPKPPPSEPEANRTGNVAFLAQQFSNTHISNRSVVPGASPSKEPAPETNAHSYAGSGGYGYDDENKQDDVRAANQLDYPSNDPYTRDFFQQDYYRSQGPQSPPDAYQQQQYMSQYGYYGPGDGEYQGENPYGGQNPNMPYNSLNRGGYPNHVDYAYGNGYPSRVGYMSPQARKESTSFEHEQPAPSPLVRIPKDLSRGRQVTFSNQARTNADYVDTVITLLRTDEGFGFRILGGAEEGSQVTIGQVLPGGAAAADGRLRYGDELVAIDGHPVLGASHHHVISLMSAAGVNGRVSLTIRRPASGVNSRFSPEHGGQTSDNVYPYDITVNRRENEGFGFVIISSLAKAGSTIGRIIEGSPAERCGKLHIGDRILAVNGQSILHLPHGDIVSMIKDSGYSVTLRIGPPQDDNSSTASTSQRGESEGIEEEYYSVELARGDRGFGFSIRGGKEFQNMPLFVLRMAEGGPAAVDGRLNVGDQIMEINGVNTKDMAHAEAIELIKAGPTVRLVVKRGVGMLPAALERAGSLAGSGIIGADSDEPPSPGPGTSHFGMSYNRPQKISPQHAYYYPPHSTHMNGPGMAPEYGGGPPNGQPNGPMMYSSSHVQPKPYNEVPVGNGGEAMMYNSYWDTYSVPASPSKR